MIEGMTWPSSEPGIGEGIDRLASRRTSNGVFAYPMRRVGSICWVPSNNIHCLDIVGVLRACGGT
jgi:hypothetical protein